MLAGAVIDQLAKRVRDVHSLATSRPDMLVLLTHAQRVVQCAPARVTEEVLFELQPHHLVYNIRDIDERCVEVVGVQIGDVSLRTVGWSALAQGSRYWFREMAQRPRVWAMVGTELFVVHPGPVAAMDCTVVCVRLPRDLASEETELLIHEEYVPVMLDLAEGLLLMRQRLFGPASPVLGRAMRAMGLEVQQDSAEETADAKG